jgi:recombination protein RecA
MNKKKPKSEENIEIGNIDALVNRLEKKFGKGTIMNENSAPLPDVKFIPTTICSLDCVLGGGFPSGRMIECFGPESSGKSTLAYWAIAIQQRLGRNALLIDAENTYDPNYGKVFGIDNSKLLLCQPSCGEEGLTVAEDAVKSQAVHIIVIDSVAALTPKSEIDGEMGAAQMGAQARLISQACRKLTALVAKADCTLIWINQLRMKLAVMWGNPETTTGGNALKFYCSQRIDVRRLEWIPKDKESVKKGMVQKIKVVKNKVAPPFRETTINLMFNSGYDIAMDLFNTATDYEIIEKNGTTYSFNGNRLGVGYYASVNALRGSEAKDIRKAIRIATKEAYRGQHE